MLKIGSSLLTVECLIFIGCIILARPIISKTLTIQLPITLAKAIAPSPLLTLWKDITISGAHVPNATIVKEIKILDTFNFKAKEEAASTKISEDLTIIKKPSNNKIISKISFRYQIPLLYYNIFRL